MQVLPYHIWDVFTDTALDGVPVTVIPDGSLSSFGNMRLIAETMRLSETSIVLSQDSSNNGDAFPVSFFSPQEELPIASHTSIATIYALHHAGRIAADAYNVKLLLSTGVVDTFLEQQGGKLKRVWLDSGYPELLETFDGASKIADYISVREGDIDSNLPVQVGSSGLPFLLVPVTNLDALKQATLNHQGDHFIRDLQQRATVVFTHNTPNADVEVRVLSNSQQVLGNNGSSLAFGPLGAYLANYGALEFKGNDITFNCLESIPMGRPNQVLVYVNRNEHGFQVQIGGAAVLLSEGRLYL